MQLHPPKKEAGFHLIGLSTCSETVTNGRVILFGKLTDKKQDKKGGVPKSNEKDQK